MNKYLFEINPELIKNFPKLFYGKKSKTTAFSFLPDNIAKNKYVHIHKKVKAKTGSEFIQKIVKNHKLLESLDGLILWGDDDMMYQIAHSKISVATKIKILPTGNSAGLQILGSKVGQSKVFSHLNLRTPKTFVAKNKKELINCVKNIKNPYIIKGDRFGGGGLVRKISTKKDETQLDFPNTWFPVLVQEFIDGQLVALETFFKDGQLLAWMYSSKVESLGEYGPSYFRNYHPPTNLDFEEDLINFGKFCGLTGMFNCTLILRGSKHYLIEADGRPNSWHFLFQHFKLPIIEIYDGEIPIPLKPLSPTFKFKKSESIIDLNRSLHYAMSLKSKKILFKSFKYFFHSTNWISGQKREAIKLMKFASVQIFHFHIRMLIFQRTVRIFRKLPARAQSFFKRLGFTKFIAFKIFKV
jgi:hypothetical protein